MCALVRFFVDCANVSSFQGLSKKQRNQQTRIWELLHTEVEYIQKLKVIIDVSEKHLQIQAKPILTLAMFKKISAHTRSVQDKASFLSVVRMRVRL